MTEATTEETLPPQTFQDDMHKMQFDLLNGLINERNSLVGQFNAVSGDEETLTEQIRESDDDPEIVAAREAWAEAYLNLMALVEPKVKAIIANTQGSTEELEKQIKELDTKLKPGLTYFKKMYGENAAKYFDSQDRVRGAIRAGGGGKRVRGFDVIVTIDGEDRQFENAAGAAKFIGGDVETSDLQKAFFEKAGVEASKDAPDVVSLTLDFVEVDGDGNKTDKQAFVKFVRSNASNDAEAETNEADEEPANDPEDEPVTEGEVDLSQF
jgi:hypothetical protein